MTTSIISRLGRSPEEGIKAPVKVQTTANITLNGSPQTINTVTVNDGERVLVKDQTDQSENGIWIVGPNDWERATDFNADDDVENGVLVCSAFDNALYQIQVTKPWTPGSGTITFPLFALGGNPLTGQDLIIQESPDHNSATIDPGFGYLWVRDDTPNVLMFTDDAGTDWVVNQTLAGGADTQVQYNSSGSLAGNANLTYDGTTLLCSTGITAGDPGFEGTGVNINGITFNSIFKASDIGSANIAQMILHKHSATYPPYFVTARSQGDAAGHQIVNANDDLCGFVFTGWDGASYAVGAEITVVVDGTPALDDMPGRIEFYTTPSGAQVALRRLQLRQDGNLEIEGGDLVFDEGADHNATAILGGKGYLWVRNDTPNVLIFTDDDGTDWVLNAAVSGGVTVEDEGTPLATVADTLDFVGAGVTATGAGTTKTITIPGGGSGLTIEEEGGVVAGGPHTTLNFIGDAITATDAGGGTCDITVGGSTSEPIISKYKPSGTAKSNDDTLADDPDLSGFVLEANTTYAIEGWFQIEAASVTPDFQFEFDIDVAVAFGFKTILHNQSDTGQVTPQPTSLTTTTTVDITSLDERSFWLKGVIRTGGSQTTVDFQWAQDTANASSVVLAQGSWLEFTQIDPGPLSGVGGGGITVEDEGSPLATVADTLNFTGAGVTASGTGSTKTINIPGGAGSFDGNLQGSVNTATPPTTEAVDTIYNLLDGDGTDLLASIGFESGNTLIIRSAMHAVTAGIEFYAQDNAGIDHLMMQLRPDTQQSSLYYDGNACARTQNPAAGGWQVNNTDTGGGFERALTIADKKPGELVYTFSSSTSMANPGNGNFRFNNGTISSVTQIAISGTLENWGGGTDIDVTSLWDALGNGSQLYLSNMDGDTEEVAIFTINSVTDNTGWYLLGVTYEDSGSAFTDSEDYAAVLLNVGAAGGGINNVVEDVTPQAGGDFDMNAFDIFQLTQAINIDRRDATAEQTILSLLGNSTGLLSFRGGDTVDHVTVRAINNTDLRMEVQSATEVFYVGLPAENWMQVDDSRTTLIGVNGAPSAATLGANDVLAITNNGSANMSFVAGLTDSSSIKFFKAGEAALDGRIRYDHNTDQMEFAVSDGVNNLAILSTGVLRILNNATYESVISDDDDIPNKKYVDDAVAGAGGGGGGGGAPGYWAVHRRGADVTLGNALFTLNPADDPDWDNLGAVLQFTSTDETVTPQGFTTGTNDVTIDETGIYEIHLNVTTRPNQTQGVYPQITDGTTVLETSFTNRAAVANASAHGSTQYIGEITAGTVIDFRVGNALGQFAVNAFSASIKRIDQGPTANAAGYATMARRAVDTGAASQLYNLNPPDDNDWDTVGASIQFTSGDGTADGWTIGTNQMTCNRAGLYFVYFEASGRPTVTSRFYPQIVDNSTTVLATSQGTQSPNAGNSTDASCSYIGQFNAGDVLTFHIGQSSSDVDIFSTQVQIFQIDSGGAFREPAYAGIQRAGATSAIGDALFNLNPTDSNDWDGVLGAALQFTSTDSSVAAVGATIGTNEITIDEDGVYEIAMQVGMRPSIQDTPLLQITDGTTVLAVANASRAPANDAPSTGTLIYTAQLTAGTDLDFRLLQSGGDIEVLQFSINLKRVDVPGGGATGPQTAALTDQFDFDNTAAYVDFLSVQVEANEEYLLEAHYRTTVTTSGHDAQFNFEPDGTYEGQWHEIAATVSGNIFGFATGGAGATATFGSSSAGGGRDDTYYATLALRPTQSGKISLQVRQASVDANQAEVEPGSYMRLTKIS